MSPGGGEPAAGAQVAVDAAAGSVPGVSWSICLRGAGGEVLAAHEPDSVLPVASVGKLLLLTAAAQILVDDPRAGAVPLARTSGPAVAQAGLWQYLRVEALPMSDVAALVAAVSDNLATNVLLGYVGLDRTAALTAELGLVHTALLDHVRDTRTAADPPTLATGTAAELSGLMARLADRTLVSAAVSDQVSAWLTLNCDLAMVAEPLDLDPLAHRRPAGDAVWLRNKTGSDQGNRADVGVVTGSGTRVSYAVVARWPGPDQPTATGVVAAMRGVGRVVRDFLQTSAVP